MKKTIKLLSVLLGIILALTPILSLTASADGTTTDTTTKKGKLAITEIFVGDKNNSPHHQYIEIMNVSSTDVYLADYYLYRTTRANANNGNAAYVADILLGQQASWAATQNYVTKIAITDDTTEKLAPGQIAVLYLQSDTTIDKTAFKTKWGIADTVKVLVVNVSEYVANKIANPAGSGNNSFLPDAYFDSILSVIHKDATMTVNGASVKICETDDVHGQTVNDATQNLHYEYLDDRYAAADCNVVYDPVGWAGDNARQFYGFVNMSKCEELISYDGDFSNFVTGKLTQNGTYDATTGNGVATYYSNGAGSNICFFAGGDQLMAESLPVITPGTLLQGQFGHNSVKILGYQEANNANNIRIVASFEADALMANAVGFDIVAKVGDDTLTLTKDLYTVYASLKSTFKLNSENEVVELNKTYLDGKGDGHDYFVALTIQDINTTVTFTVTPYVINGGLKTTGTPVEFEYTPVVQA